MWLFRFSLSFLIFCSVLQYNTVTHFARHVEVFVLGSRPRFSPKVEELLWNFAHAYDTLCQLISLKRDSLREDHVPASFIYVVSARWSHISRIPFSVFPLTKSTFVHVKCKHHYKVGYAPIN